MPSFLFLLLAVGLAVANDQAQEPTLSKEEKELFTLTNQERTKEEMPVLRVNARLCQAAKDHARNMAKQQKLDHDLDDETPADRVRKAGYRYSFLAENISCGQKDPAEAIAIWLKSEQHKENLLNNKYTEIGIGIAEDTEQKKYFVQVFAAPVKR